MYNSTWISIYIVSKEHSEDLSYFSIISLIVIFKIITLVVISPKIVMLPFPQCIYLSFQALRDLK